MDVRSRLLSLTPETIAAIYVSFGLLWILGSDRVVLLLFTSEAVITTIQTVKGAVFVGLSGFLIWYLASRRESQLRESHERLQAATQRLGVLQRVFRHNIRNDMNVVQGYIELARSGSSSPEVHTKLATASATAGDVIGIGEKLGILDQYGFRPLEAETEDLVELTSEAVSRFSESHPAATVTIATPDSARVVGDESIAHVLDELLENTAEHYEGPLESLRVEVSVIDGEEWGTVRVEDNGPGIPEGELRALRTGHESNLIHLSSVGYWLVYWLCERLDADIDIETGNGTGTTIEIAVPKEGTDIQEGAPAPLRQQG